MQDFKYYAPTEVVFGKDAEEHLVEMINKYGGKIIIWEDLGEECNIPIWCQTIKPKKKISVSGYKNTKKILVLGYKIKEKISVSGYKNTKKISVSGYKIER